MKNFVEGFQPRSRLDRDGSGDITNTPIDMQSWDSSLNDLEKVKISRRDFLKFALVSSGGLFISGSNSFLERVGRSDVTIATRPARSAYFWKEIQPGENLRLAEVLPIEVKLIRAGLMKVNWNDTEVNAQKYNEKNRWVVVGDGRQSLEWNPQDDLVISGSFPFTMLAESSNPVTRQFGGDLFIHDTVHSIVATWAFKDISAHSSK